MPATKTALVAGGSGGIGEGIVKTLIADGFVVYVPTRAGDNSERLQAFVDNSELLRLIPADLCSEGEVSALRDEIVSEANTLDAVVVSVGSRYFGHRLHRMPRTDWDRSIQDNLATHFNLQRSFVDLLRSQDTGVYITLIGPESESIHPEEGVVSIMAGAQKMMTRVIAQEAFDSNVRVHTVTAHTSITTRSRGENVNPDWIAAEELGRYVLALINGTIPGSNDVMHELRNQNHVDALLKAARA